MNEPAAGEALLARELPIARTRELRQAVLRPHQTLDQLAAEEAPDVFACGVIDGDRVLAVGLIAPDGDSGSWRVRGMATAPEARGRGHGSAVLALLIEHARRHGATRVWCNARTPARAFYEHVGFSVASEEFELPDIGPHFVMARAV